MQKIKQVAQNTQFSSEFKDFVKSYQQVTLMGMEKIRQKVLKTRSYTDGLQNVFVDVKQTHVRQIEQLLQRNPGHKLSFSTIVKNGKQAVILLSPKTKFSGNINRQVFSRFTELLKTNQKQIDVFILGTTGEYLFKQQYPGQPYEIISDIDSSLKKILLYEKIDVFFARFYNVVDQEPVSVNLSGEKNFLDDLETVQPAVEQNRRFLFEPKLEQILNFFEIQIFSVLLRRTIEESDLAHLGARLTTLESTTQRLEVYTKKLSRNYQKLRRLEKNKKQRQGLAGIQLWN